MTRPWILVFALACAGPTATTAPPRPTPGTDRPPRETFAVVDTMPDFWEFWDLAQGLPAEEAFAHFEATVVARHPAVFAPEVLGYEGELHDRFEPWFEELPGRIDAIRRQATAFPDELRTAAHRFAEALPAFHWDGTVYLIVSLDSFNGAGRVVDEEPALLFGLDVIADQGTSMPAPVLVAHELFHMHQRVPTEPSMAGAMWVEGLATYASQVLVPTACLDEILPEGHLHSPADPQLVSAERGISFARDMPRYERRLAGELLEAFDRLSASDYAAFFLGRADPSLGERPVRSGYYFGYLAARDLGAERSLQELSQLEVAEVESSLRETLRSIADDGTRIAACPAERAGERPAGG